MSQLDLDLALRPRDCEHRFCFVSLNGDAAALYCDACESKILSYIPDPPEVLGYVSATWKHWEEQFPKRYPHLARAQFALIPREDDK